MALQNYNHVTVADTPFTLCTAATGHEIAVVSILASAGAAPGSLTITVNNGTSDVYTVVLAFVDAYNAAFLDSKIFLPAGYILKVTGSVDGISVMASADDSEV